MTRSIMLGVALALVAAGCPEAARAQAADAPGQATSEDRFIAEALPPHLAARVSQLDQARIPVPGQEALVARMKVFQPSEFPIRVCFFGGSPQLRSEIAKAALEWSTRLATQGGRLDLDFGDLSAPKSCFTNEFNHIRVGFAYQGYWSMVGQDSYQAAAQYEQSMNFAHFDVVPPRNQAEFRRIVMHEFGHALGLYHEHQNPFSVCQQEFDFDAIYTYLAGPPNFWPRERVDFNLRPIFNDIDATRFDPESIMLYTFPESFYKRGGQSSCFSETNYEPSATDVNALALYYPADALVAQQDLNRAVAQYSETLSAATLPAETRLRALKAVEPLSAAELSPERKRAIAQELLGEPSFQ